MHCFSSKKLKKIFKSTKIFRLPAIRMFYNWFDIKCITNFIILSASCDFFIIRTHIIHKVLITTITHKLRLLNHLSSPPRWLPDDGASLCHAWHIRGPGKLCSCTVAGCFWLCAWYVQHPLPSRQCYFKKTLKKDGREATENLKKTEKSRRFGSEKLQNNAKSTKIT